MMMMIGLPVVGLATTELSRVILESGGGYADTELAALVAASRPLVADPPRADGSSRAPGMMNAADLAALTSLS